MQAYSGMEGKASEKAAELLESEDAKVPVVCTPNGGAQSVRLNLEKNWDDELSEEQLLDAIFKSKRIV